MIKCHEISFSDYFSVVYLLWLLKTKTMLKYYFICYTYEFDCVEPEDDSVEHIVRYNDGLFKTTKRDMKKMLKTVTEIELSDVEYTNLSINIEDYGEVKFHNKDKDE